MQEENMCQELWLSLGRPILGSGGGVLTVSTESMCILKYKIKILSHVYSDRSNGHMLISPEIEQLYAS